MQGQKYLSSPVIILLITALSIICPISTDMYLPALSEIVSYFGTTESVLNVTLYGFFFMQAIGILFLGPLSDKFGRKYLLLAAIAVYSAASVFCSLASSIEWFIILRCIQGFSAGGLVVISTALIKDCFRDEKVRSRVLTLTVFFGVIGPVVAPILGAWIIQTVSWQFTLSLPAFLTILCLIIAFFLTEPLAAEEKLNESVFHVLGHLARLFRHRPFTLFLLSMGVLSLSFMAYIAVSSYIFVDDFGIPGMMYSIFMAGNAILATLGMLIVQKITPRIGIRAIGLFLIVLVMVSGVLLLTAGGLHAGICIACILPCSIAVFSSRPYALNILLQQYDGDTGSVSSLFNFVVMIFSCVGMFLGALPWATHLFGLGCTMLIGGLTALVFWVLFRAGGMKLKGF